MKRALLSLAVVALLGCNPPAPKTVQPAPPRDPWPQGTVLVSRNPQETDNRTPGFWNHLAIYTGNFQLVESQEGRGVITTTTKEYNARGYTWYPLFPKDIHQGVVAAAKAQTLVGLPYRAGSSLLGEDRNPERGLNCVSVVRISYASAVGHGFPELKIPDNIVLLDGDVLTKTNPKNEMAKSAKQPAGGGSSPPAAVTRRCLIAVRASGGFLRHLKPQGKYSALCGHSPMNSRGMNRARWVHGNRVFYRECEKCNKIAARDGLELIP